MRFRQHQDDARQATRRLLWLFILTVTLTVLAVNAALALAWGFATGNLFGYPRWFFETNTGVALGFILGGGWLETLRLRQGGAHVATMVGGREILSPANLTEQRFRNVVDEMAIASGLKPPRLFVLDREDAINAFAAGWEQQDSVVAVTRGALERLTRDELQGVVAHEFSHILHGDTRLNMRLIGYVYGLQLIFNYGRSMFDMTDAHHRRSFSMVPGLALMAAGSAGWLAGRLLKAAVSRQREFLADASAIQYTRQPTGIGNALRKIASQVEAGAGAVRNANAEVVSHLMLSSTIFEHGGWLATHPPLSDRLARIFGRPTAPLPADVLPQEGLEAAPERDDGIAFVAPPRVPAAGQPPVTAAQSMPVAPARTAEPVEPPADAAQPARLHALLGLAMPGDLTAAALAFLVRRDSELEHSAWQAAVPSTPAREAMLQSVWQLQPNARLPWLERLLTRCEAMEPKDRLALRRRAHRIVAADQQVTAGELLTCLLIDHLLGLSPVVLTREVQRRSLGDVAPAVKTFTAVLAALLEPPQRQVWTLAVCQALELDGTLPSPRADLTSMTASLQELNELSAMARPALMKVWVQLGTAGGQALRADFADALRTLCLLIDTPLPPALVAWYGGPR
jgi:Zn-dependent protease with chaperone function